MEKTYEEIKYTNDEKRKKDNWDIAIGLNEVDGLTPSKYLYELVEDSIKGIKTYRQVEDSLRNYYKERSLDDIKEQEKMECDIVSTRIAEFLEDNGFAFSPIYLKEIHKYLFHDIFPEELSSFVGRFRDYNIVKKEDILDGNSVTYANASSIEGLLKYDFDEEKNKTYKGLNKEEQVKRIMKFVSSIWQIHPFVEGNTRTTALFIEKYLNTMGYKVNNELFKDNSKYFRNALVLSNYTNISEGIYPEFIYLEAFFKKLLIDKDYKLPKM